MLRGVEMCLFEWCSTLLWGCSPYICISEIGLEPVYAART